MKRKKNTTKESSNIIWFDTDISYIIPMMPDTNHPMDFEEQPVEMKVTQDDKGYVKASAPGYKDKYFADRSFQFLVDTGYIKKLRLK